MKKEGGKKKLVIIVVVVIVILLVLAVAGYFILNKTTGFSFGFNGFYFSGGLENIGKSGNAFEDAKLNPFVNGTG